MLRATVPNDDVTSTRHVDPSSSHHNTIFKNKNKIIRTLYDGQFLLHALIGKGGFGEVYYGTDTLHHHEPVAIKVEYFYHSRKNNNNNNNNSQKEVKFNIRLCEETNSSSSFDSILDENESFCLNHNNNTNNNNNNQTNNNNNDSCARCEKKKKMLMENLSMRTPYNHSIVSANSVRSPCFIPNQNNNNNERPMSPTTPLPSAEYSPASFFQTLSLSLHKKEEHTSLLEESNIMRKLHSFHHPHHHSFSESIRPLYFGQEKNYQFLVMDIKGPSVSDLLKVFHRFSLKTSVLVCLQVLGQIERLHALEDGGVLHRDIKPENIVLGITPGKEADYFYEMEQFFIHESKVKRDAKEKMQLLRFQTSRSSIRFSVAEEERWRESCEEIVRDTKKKINQTHILRNVAFMENVSDQLFLIDFGLSCPLSASIGDANDQQNVNEHCQKELFNPRKKPLIGTMQFASLNTHKAVPHHYKDDIEQLLYVFIYVYLGELPWTTIIKDKTLSRSEVEARVGKMKLKLSEEEITKNCPREIYDLLKYIRKELKWNETPDYRLIRHTFYRMLEKIYHEDLTEHIFYDEKGADDIVVCHPHLKNENNHNNHQNLNNKNKNNKLTEFNLVDSVFDWSPRQYYRMVNKGK